MSRSIGGTSLTTLPPISTSPSVASSSPAVIRSTVVLPDPDGPTRTRNSPSSISRSRSSTATVPPSNTLRKPTNRMSAIDVSVRARGDQVPVPERASLRDPPLRREVDEDDSKALVVAVLPFEVVEERPDVVATHVDPFGARSLDRVDVPVQVRDAPLVVDAPVVEPVVERRAVLRDQQGDLSVVALQPQEELRQRRRIDRPAHRGLLGSGRGLVDAHDGIVARDDDVRVVEVDAEEVERLCDQVEVAVGDVVSTSDVRLVQLEHVLGVRTAEERVEEPAVAVSVQPQRRRLVLARGRRRPDDCQVERDPDAAAVAARTERLHRGSVRQQEVMRDAQREPPVLRSGRLRPVRMAEEGGHPRLVVRDPVVDGVTELVEHDLRVLGEPLDDVARSPTARILQRLRQIPVVERREWDDLALAQPGGETAVEVQALAIRAAAAVRLDSRPRDREAVALQPERPHQVEVLAPAEVVLARGLAGVAAVHVPVLRSEAIPDRLAAPVDLRRALDLVRGGRCAPNKVNQPLIAPCMIPPMICLPSTRNTRSSGRIEMKVPVRISA